MRESSRSSSGSGRSASIASNSQDAWGHSPPALTGGELDFLSHTPPVAASAEDKPSTARRRTSGPRHGTYESAERERLGRAPARTQFIHGGSGGSRGPPKPPEPPPRGGRHAVRRLRSVATLRQQGAVDDQQANAIKDLLLSSETMTKLHAASRYVPETWRANMTDSKELVELAKRGGLEMTQGSSSARVPPPRDCRGDSVASVGLEFEHLMDLDAGLSGVPVVFDGPSPRRRTGCGKVPDGLGPAFAMDFEDPEGADAASTSTLTRSRRVDGSGESRPWVVFSRRDEAGGESRASPRRSFPIT